MSENKKKEEYLRQLYLLFFERHPFTSFGKFFQPNFPILNHIFSYLSKIFYKKYYSCFECF